MSYLKKIQSSPEHVKRRWLVFTTAFVMVGVLYLWVGYFSGILDTTKTASNTESTGFSFGATMRNGAAILYDAFVHKAQTIKNTIQGPSEITITPNQ